MDFVGPLPRTQRGNRFILTICDYATPYPEAIALPSTDTSRVARELIAFFAQVGIPEEILTDQGSNFMSTMLEIYRLLQVKRIHTTLYHPQTDGLVERFNGTLKMMLRKFVSRSQKDWDKCLPHLLFAYQQQKSAYDKGSKPRSFEVGEEVLVLLHDTTNSSWNGLDLTE